MDSDIVLPRDSTVAIGEALRWAEAHQVGVVANYRMATGQNVVMVNRESTVNHHLSDAEWQGLPDYAEVGMSGFGFAYLPQPLHCTFHADTTGEDIHFWRENPQIRLHCAKQIHLGHRKSILL